MATATKETGKAAALTPITVAVADVEPIKGLNPRKVDTKSQRFKELVESIKKHGLLQPVLVGPRTNGKHPLIAGERRWRAAKAAGVEAITAMEAAGLEGAELEAAITENVQRQDLTPVEEARAIERLQKDRGYTQKQAAEALGKSERWVRDRLPLLQLPESAQDGYDEGVVPIETLGAVSIVSKVSPATAEALVEQVKKGKLEPEHLKPQHMTDALAYLAREKGNCLVKTGGDEWSAQQYYVDQLPIDKKVKAELVKVAEAMPPDPDSYYRGDRETVQFKSATTKAAKSYGCLLELTGKDQWGRKTTTRYLTDPEFVADQAKQILEREHKRRERETKKRAKEKAKATGSATPEAAAEKAKEQRKKELDKQRKAIAAAHRTNLELGSRLRTELARPKFDLAAARLLAELVFDHDKSGLTAHACFVDEALHDEVTLKDGTLTKIKPWPEKGYESVQAELDKAKTPQVVLGVVLRALVIGRFADREATVPSNRPYSRHPANKSWGDQTIPNMIDAIALEAGVLPEPMRKAAEQRAKGGPDA